MDFPKSLSLAAYSFLESVLVLIETDCMDLNINDYNKIMLLYFVFRYSQPNMKALIDAQDAFRS